MRKMEVRIKEKEMAKRKLHQKIKIDGRDTGEIECSDRSLEV